MPPASNFLLNTENYDPLVNIVKQITQSIRENEKILSRLTIEVDERTRYPGLPATGERDNGKQEIVNDQSDQPFQVTEANDYLRVTLDRKFKDNGVSEVDEFNDVENPVLRRLLSDNYRLLRIKRAKEESYRQLLHINREYERLLADVIIPALAKDVSTQNAANIKHIKESEVDLKLKAQLDVWTSYVTHLELLEKSTSLVKTLYETLEATLDSREMDRLALQMSILENLRGQAGEGELQRIQ